MCDSPGSVANMLNWSNSSQATPHVHDFLNTSSLVLLIHGHVCTKLEEGAEAGQPYRYEPLVLSSALQIVPTHFEGGLTRQPADNDGALKASPGFPSREPRDRTVPPPRLGQACHDLSSSQRRTWFISRILSQGRTFRFAGSNAGAAAFTGSRNVRLSL